MSYRGFDAFQKVDHRTRFASCARWLGTLQDGFRVEEFLDAALRAATSGRRGAAVLMLPKGMVAAPAGQSADGGPLANHLVAARVVATARPGLVDRIPSSQASPAPAVCTNATRTIAASRAEFATVDTLGQFDDRPSRTETVVVACQRHAEIAQFGRATSVVALGSVDYAAHAPATGAHGVTVSTRAELEEDELARAVGSSRTAVIE